MEIMERECDWDAFDLLHRVIARHPGLYSSTFSKPLEDFAERHRYDPKGTRGRHHYDVLRSKTKQTMRPTNNNTIIPLPEEVMGWMKPIAENVEVDNVMEGQEGLETKADDTTMLTQNLFSDTQNIHTSGIQRGTMESLETLCKWYAEYVDNQRQRNPQYTVPSVESVMEEIYHVLETENPQRLDGVRSFLDRIGRDPSTIVLFEKCYYPPATVKKRHPPIPDHPTVLVSLRDVLVWVWTYIRLMENTDLIQRFVQECNESMGTCFSGHSSRLINCLVGFHPEIRSTTLNVEDLSRIHLQKILNDALEHSEEEEDVLVDMIVTDPSDPGYRRFKRWVVKNKMNFRKKMVEKLLGSGFTMDEIFDKDKDNKDNKDHYLENPTTTDPIAVAWDRMFPYHYGLLNEKLTWRERLFLFFRAIHKNFNSKTKPNPNHRSRQKDLF